MPLPYYEWHLFLNFSQLGRHVYVIGERDKSECMTLRICLMIVKRIIWCHYTRIFFRKIGQLY